MCIDSKFVAELEAVDLQEFMSLLESDDRPHFETSWILKNEIKPVDLFCYLQSRFGIPNGMQNYLRGNHTDNLIHWQWALKSNGRIILIQGLNYRTEIWISGPKLGESLKELLITSLKNSFSDYGLEMGKTRKSLEHWVEFINPYQRLKRSIKGLTTELSSLNIEDELKLKKDFLDYEDSKIWEQDWKRQSSKFSLAIGLCFGIRSMLPVMAEAFINLLLYMLMKPNLKGDERLRENLIRQPIDIRVKSLSHNCVGFKSHIDYSHESCRRYHSLVNERNDLLHGNVVIDKLKFNEVYFQKNVPVFSTYSTMWERAFGVLYGSVGLELINDELETVDSFIGYVISCLEDPLQEQVRYMIGRSELGLCLDDERLGVLFASHLIDLGLPQ